jgi:hypothetical protein
LSTTYPWINRRNPIGAIFLGAHGYLILPGDDAGACASRLSGVNSI